MQEVFNFTNGAFSGNGNFSISLNVEFDSDDAKPCIHCFPVITSHGVEGFVCPSVVCATADDGSVSTVCLQCAVDAGHEVSNTMLPGFALLKPKKKPRK